MTKRNEVAFRGKEKRIWCVFGGTPLPEIRWRKKGGALPWGRTTYDNYGKTLIIKVIGVKILLLWTFHNRLVSQLLSHLFYHSIKVNLNLGWDNIAWSLKSMIFFSSSLKLEFKKRTPTLNIVNAGAWKFSKLCDFFFKVKLLLADFFPLIASLILLGYFWILLHDLSAKF